MVKFVATETLEVELDDSLPIFYPGDLVEAFGDSAVVIGLDGDKHAQILFDATQLEETVSISRISRMPLS